MELNHSIWAIVLYTDIYRAHKRLDTLTEQHGRSNLVFRSQYTVGKLSAVSHKDALSDRLYNLTYRDGDDPLWCDVVEISSSRFLYQLHRQKKSFFRGSDLSFEVIKITSYGMRRRVTLGDRYVFQKLIRVKVCLLHLKLKQKFVFAHPCPFSHWITKRLAPEIVTWSWQSLIQSSYLFPIVIQAGLLAS
jgi:hypothetical protein